MMISISSLRKEFSEIRKILLAAEFEEHLQIFS